MIQRAIRIRVSKKASFQKLTLTSRERPVETEGCHSLLVLLNEYAWEQKITKVVVRKKEMCEGRGWYCSLWGRGHVNYLENSGDTRSDLPSPAGHPRSAYGRSRTAGQSLPVLGPSFCTAIS